MRPVAALALAVVLVVPATAVRAQADAPPREERRSELPESVLRAERQTGGQVLRAESMQRDGREVYRLKVLTPDGRVRIMRDDPRERRREAWRERDVESADARFHDPRRPHDADLGDPSRRIEDRFEERRGRDDPAPADLELPETLPPAERGDRH